MQGVNFHECRRFGRKMRYWRHVTAFGIALGLVHVPAFSQTAPLPALSNFEPRPGFTLGDFVLSGRLQVGVNPTSNVRLDPTEQADVRRVLAADTSLQSKWKRHSLAFAAQYSNQAASETEDEENDMQYGMANLRLDLTSTLNATVAAIYEETLVDQNNPDYLNGLLNEITIENTLQGGLNWDDHKNFAALQYRYQDISSESDVNSTDPGGDSDLGDDRIEQDTQLQYGWHTAWGRYYIIGGTQWATYTGDAVYEDRNSFGGRIGVGVEYANKEWQASAQLIAFSQTFASSDLGTVTSFVGTAQATRRLTDKWALGGLLQRSFDETNITGSGGIFTDLVGAGVQYQPVDNVYIKTGPTFRYFEIQGTPYDSWSISLDTTAAWQVQEHLEVLFTSTLFSSNCNEAYLEDLGDGAVYDDYEMTLSLVFTF